jgi:hypothetical protein
MILKQQLKYRHCVSWKLLLLKFINNLTRLEKCNLWSTPTFQPHAGSRRSLLHWIIWGHWTFSCISCTVTKGQWLRSGVFQQWLFTPMLRSLPRPTQVAYHRRGKHENNMDGPASCPSLTLGREANKTIEVPRLYILDELPITFSSLKIKRRGERSCLASTGSSDHLKLEEYRINF